MESLTFDYLKDHGFNPFSILFFRIGDVDIMKLSFYDFQDLDKLKEILDYKYSSDKLGYIEIEKHNTVLLKGLLLSILIREVKKWNSKN